MNDRIKRRNLARLQAAAERIGLIPCRTAGVPPAPKRTAGGPPAPKRTAGVLPAPKSEIGNPQSAMPSIRTYVAAQNNREVRRG